MTFYEEGYFYVTKIDVPYHPIMARNPVHMGADATHVVISIQLAEYRHSTAYDAYTVQLIAHVDHGLVGLVFRL